MRRVADKQRIAEILTGPSLSAGNMAFNVGGPARSLVDHLPQHCIHLAQRFRVHDLDRQRFWPLIEQFAAVGCYSADQIGARP